MAFISKCSIADKQNRIPYQLMDIPDDSDTVEDKENDEIPISPDIRLLNTEGKNFLLPRSFRHLMQLGNFELKYALIRFNQWLQTRNGSFP